MKPEPKKKSPAPQPGSLSVYFLGGIGEFYLDGKLFKQQPPFTAMPVSAGRHKIGCKMHSDEAVREIEINVISGRETIIEYEAGKQPVASQNEGS